MRIPFRKYTVDTITAPITRIVTQLNEHVAVHDNLADHHKTKAANHDTLALASIEEANKATQRARAIGSLLV